MRKFFSFERMITPIIIKFLFWVGVISSAISGLVVFVALILLGFYEGSLLAILAGVLLGILAGMFVVVFGAFISRIYAELLILAFRINETLTDIKDILRNQ